MQELEETAAAIHRQERSYSHQSAKGMHGQQEQHSAWVCEYYAAWYSSTITLPPLSMHST